MPRSKTWMAAEKCGNDDAARSRFHRVLPSEIVKQPGAEARHIVLAAEIRASSVLIFVCPLLRSGFSSAPAKEGAERRRARGQRPCRSSTATGLDHFRGRPRLTALHCGVFSALASTLGPRCPLAPAWPFGSGRGHGTSPRRLSYAGRPDPRSPGVMSAKSWPQAPLPLHVRFARERPSCEGE